MEEDIGVTMQLVRSAKAGDRAALDELFKRYYEKVHRVARIRLWKSLRQRMESQDIVQQAFVAALKSFDRFELRDRASFMDWLATLVENRIRDNNDTYSAEKRDPTLEVRLGSPADTGPIGAEPAASGPSPSEEFARREKIERVDEALAKLPERSRELIICRQFLDLSWKEVAERTGHPSFDAARMAFGKALMELAELLEGFDGLDGRNGAAAKA